MTYEAYEKLLKERGVNSAAVSRATGISQTVFSEWKKGKSSPKTDKLQKIADYFGVTLDYLTSGEVKEGYYLNGETARAAQEILESKELSMLFDVSRDMSPEDLRTVYQMALALKRKEQGY